MYNHTHTRWQQIMTDPVFFNMSAYGTVIDDTWVVQHAHGPFSLAAAPKHYPTDTSLGVSVRYTGDTHSRT